MKSACCHAKHPPVRLFAELASADVVDGTQAELVGARRDEAADGNASRLRLDVGQQHRPGGV